MDKKKMGRNSFVVLLAVFGAAGLSGLSGYLDNKNFDAEIFTEQAAQPDEIAVDRRLSDGEDFNYVHVIGGSGKHAVLKMAATDAKIGAIAEVMDQNGQVRPAGMVHMYLPGDDKGFELASLRVNNALKVARGECAVNVIFESQEPVTSCSRWQSITHKTTL
jgi:hypothetical protein